MVINPTHLAQRTRQCMSLPMVMRFTKAYFAAVNWSDAKRRVLKSYREWIRAVRYALIRIYISIVDGALKGLGNREHYAANWRLTGCFG